MLVVACQVRGCINIVLLVKLIKYTSGLAGTCFSAVCLGTTSLYDSHEATQVAKTKTHINGFCKPLMILDCTVTKIVRKDCVTATKTAIPGAGAGTTRAYPWDACDMLEVSLRAPVACPAFKVKHLQQIESRWS